MMLFQPVTETEIAPSVKLIDAATNREVSESEYFDQIRQIFNRRNPHHAVGKDILQLDDPE